MKEKEHILKGPDGKPLPFVREFHHQLSFAIGSHGPWSSGKSRLAATGPDLTFIMPIDSKSRRTIEKTMREFGKEPGKNILMPPEGFIEDINPRQAERMDLEKSTAAYRGRVERIKDYLLAAHDNPEVRLIVVDTASQLFEEMTYANYGRVGHKILKITDAIQYKDKSKANQEFVDLIRTLKSKPLLLIHTSKEEYVKNRSTGQLTMEGMKNIGYQCEVVIQHEFNRTFNADDPDQNWQFAITVQACQDEVQLQGPDGRRLLTDEMITIGNIMNRVFPDSNWEDWQ